MHHVILLRLSPEVSGCKFGFSQREGGLSHHLSHFSLSLKERKKTSPPLETLLELENKLFFPLFITDFDDFAKDLTEAHGEGVGFLLEQVAAGLSPFQPSLHDGLSPASQNRTTTHFQCHRSQ